MPTFTVLPKGTACVSPTRLWLLETEKDFTTYGDEHRGRKQDRDRWMQRLQTGLTFRSPLANLEGLHHSAAFGYALGIPEIALQHTVSAFLHQLVLNTISAGQRLFPLGR